jgi:hypothetical protein
MSGDSLQQPVDGVSNEQALDFLLKASDKHLAETGQHYDACLVTHEESEGCESCDRVRRRKYMRVIAQEADRNRDRDAGVVRMSRVCAMSRDVVHNANRLTELGLSLIIFADSVRTNAPVLARSAVIPEEPLFKYLQMTNDVIEPVANINQRIVAYADSDRRMVDQLKALHEEGIQKLNAAPLVDDQK